MVRGLSAARYRSELPLAIVAALPQEVAGLLEAGRFRLGQPGVWRGRLGETPVVVAVLGIGKVRAAACAQRILDRYHPRAVILVGAAGSVNPALGVGDLVVAQRVAQHDLALSPEARERHHYPIWQDAPAGLLQVAQEAGQDLGPEVNLRVGQIITGDQVIRDPEERQRLWQRWQADCADMESAAVALICAQRGVPCLVVRAISDRCDQNVSQDFQANIAALSRTLATFVVAVASRLAGITCPASQR